MNRYRENQPCKDCGRMARGLRCKPCNDILKTGRPRVKGGGSSPCEQGCTCGKHGEYTRESLIQRSTTHGRHKTPEYRSWNSLLQRCLNPNSTAYARYGGRGIKVCERWLSFENFFADMGERPKWADGGIDRTDNDGNYEPGNCRWVRREDQTYNKRPMAKGIRANRERNKDGTWR